jgi:hypothetical protein
MKFKLLSTDWGMDMLTLYKAYCIDIGGDCHGLAIYLKIPQSIHTHQRQRFVDALNKKSIAKSREKLI